MFQVLVASRVLLLDILPKSCRACSWHENEKSPSLGALYKKSPSMRGFDCFMLANQAAVISPATISVVDVASNVNSPASIVLSVPPA